MPSNRYLAMTAAEFYHNPQPQGPIAWMACHFSPYSTGLSNCPDRLPEGSMLIVNDRTPVCGHHPGQIAEELAGIIRRCRCSRVLLDFQRPDETETEAITSAVINALPCPVGVSSSYAKGLTCPVFLPPVPLTKPLSEHLRPWTGREVWLEMGLGTQQITVTEQGCQSMSIPHFDGPMLHEDPQLHCRYRTDITGKAITFTLQRDKDMLQSLIAEAEAAGITCFIGLYQELGQSCAQ